MEFEIFSNQSQRQKKQTFANERLCGCLLSLILEIFLKLGGVHGPRCYWPFVYPTENLSQDEHGRGYERFNRIFLKSKLF